VNIDVSGSALFGQDFAQSGAFSFSQTFALIILNRGQATADITINPTADAIQEPDETVTLTLRSNAFYTVVGSGTATGTIQTDETEITLDVSPVSVAEDGTTNLVYTFTRTGITANPLTVNFGVGGTAAYGTDFDQAGATSFNATRDRSRFQPVRLRPL
jgi:hypothetical protein